MDAGRGCETGVVTRRAVLAVLATGLALMGACSGDAATPPGPVAADGIRVASFDFAESALLAEMYAQVIESTEVPVVRLGAVGPREIVSPAMAVDRIDFVPEYLGTALQYAGSTRPEADTELARTVLNRRLEATGLTVLQATPAEDKNVFAVTASAAREHGLAAISDLSGVADTMVFGGPAECETRPLCLAGLESVYGLRFAEFSPQRSLAFTAEALMRGEIDVGLLFSTAAELEDPALVVLDDDLFMQPAENIVPLVRKDALERWGPRVTRAVNRLSTRLTTEELRGLNLRVANGQPVEVVAREWLAEPVPTDAG
jgi:osmoprotectant transport system substrate-binding protein